MRFVINGLIALMVVGIAAGVMYHRHEQQQWQGQIDQIRDDVRRFQRQVMLQTTLKHATANERGYPKTVEPSWFEDDLPRNTLLSQSHPWVEIAHEDERALTHPTIKLATQPEHSQFWYNPYNGHVRVRVPALTSDAAALELYNYLNDANLSRLFNDAAFNTMLDD